MAELTGVPKYSTKFEHCPDTDEENLCVGRLAIYCYLHLTGQVESLKNLGGQVVVDTHNIDAKILPMKISIPFSVDFSDTPTSEPDVEKCGSAMGPFTNGPMEMKYPEVVGGNHMIMREFTRFEGTANPINEDPRCIHGMVKMSWRSGLIRTGADLQFETTIDNVPFADPIVIKGSGDAQIFLLGVKTYRKSFEYRVCYPDGCFKVINPSDNATDAEAIFNSGGNP